MVTRTLACWHPSESITRYRVHFPMKYILCIVWALKYVFILESIRKKLTTKTRDISCPTLVAWQRQCKSYCVNHIYCLSKDQKCCLSFNVIDFTMTCILSINLKFYIINTWLIKSNIEDSHLKHTLMPCSNNLSLVCLYNFFAQRPLYSFVPCIALYSDFWDISYFLRFVEVIKVFQRFAGIFHRKQIFER